MRILLLNQFFWPDAAPTGQLAADVARALSSQGHEVIVICGSSSYAKGEEPQTEFCRVIRATGLPFQRGLRGRVCSYGSFLAGALWHCARMPRPDVVLTMTTPPLLSIPGNLLRRLRGARHYIWEMDVYPDIAVDLGVLSPDSLLTRVIRRVADQNRRQADGILVLGECMRQRLMSRGIPARLLQVVENWANGEEIYPVLKQPDGRLTVLYSGNLGMAHDIATIGEVMRGLQREETFQFLFAGSGARRAELAAFCEANGLRHVSFLPYCERSRLSQSLGAADIGLVTQSDVCAGSVVPSKLYSFMAAGRPVLFIGPAESTVARTVRRFDCGWCFHCNDAAGVMDLLRTLAAHPERVLQAGLRARTAFLEHYDRPHGVRRVMQAIGFDASQADPSRFFVASAAGKPV
jgi:colanic acid biosynthesis glycosyl transferase WcaI